MITTNVPSVVDEESGLYPPLGLLYVASFAEKNTSHTVEILDCLADRLTYEQLGDEIRARKPDVVGIQAMTFTLIDAILTAKAAKQANPSVPVILGGPHVFIYPEETLSIPEVDYIIRGEGEESFTQLLEALGQGGDLSGILGLGYKENGKIHLNPEPPLLEDLDRLPMPARHLVPQERYYSVLAKATPITTMMTSRGCPMRCIFCDRPHLGKRFRYRSADSVVEEMALCAQLGIQEIFIYDDTFSIRKDRVLDVCRAIKDRNLRIHWDIRAHINTLNEEVLDALAESGCSRIHYGVESGNPEILKILRKGINLNNARRVFRMTKERGITTLAYFMIGNPTETPQQIDDTFRFARELDPDFVHIAITTPFPATELYRRALDTGLYEKDFWRDFARDPRPDFVPRVWDEILSREQLIELMRKGYRRFYTRPGYLLKSLLAVRSWKEFQRKAKAGLRLLSNRGLRHGA
ncbi:MAG: radical SAM protein [bacterium]